MAKEYVALGMEPVQRVPVVSFPGSRSILALIKHRQEKQREYHFVHLSYSMAKA